MKKIQRSVSLTPEAWTKIHELEKELGLSGNDILQIAVVRAYEQKDDLMGRRYMRTREDRED